MTDRDRAILDFEAQRFHYAGAKATAVRDTFGLSMTRYAQILNVLLDDPDAYVYAPTTVNRLRRLRQSRRFRRAG